MPSALPNKGPSGPRQRIRRFASGNHWLLAALIVPLAFVVILGMVPFPLVLPALSVLLVSAGLVIAAVVLGRDGYAAAADAGRLDIAGGLLLVGFGASMLTDLPEALRSLAELQASLSPRSRDPD